MIRSIRSDKPTFHPISFKPGFNVVLADRTKEATKKDTRNGLGKSMLVEVIHFCLGADTSKHPLLAPPLADWTFTLDLELGGKPVSVSRNTSNHKRVAIDGDTTDWPIQPKQDATSHTLQLRISDWTAVLGHMQFGLPADLEGSYRPSFRSLISFFIRRGPDAYSSPFENHRKQREIFTQVYNAFLLGLDWEYPQELQVLKDKKTALENLRKAAQSGLVNDVLGSLGELEAIAVRLENEVRQSQEQLRSFRVHPQYDTIESEANGLTREIHELTNAIIADTRLLEFYQASMRDEQAPSPDRVLELYEEAGATLPELVRKRLEDIQTFHRTIIDNRRRFLTVELERLQRTNTIRRDSVRQKSDQRAALLGILETHKALDEYNRLQQRHLQHVSELNDVERRISQLKHVEDGQNQIAIQQAQLHQRARNDIEDRQEQLKKAISLFNANSEALYKAPGKLVIDVEPTGYKFRVEIERSASQGVSHMKVFCYDLMLAQLWASMTPSPRILVHDSTIFDGVDERQVALALELAERESRTRGFQYICTMNSDALPTGDFSEDFDLNGFVRLRMTDATEAGCLFGIRF